MKTDLSRFGNGVTIHNVNKTMMVQVFRQFYHGALEDQLVNRMIFIITN